MNKMNKMPIFDKDGNLNLKMEGFPCKYCGKVWEKNSSKIQHERWCEKNPNPRKISNNPKEISPGEKNRSHKKKISLHDLRKLIKTFNLTDQQIANFVRGKEDG